MNNLIKNTCALAALFIWPIILSAQEVKSKSIPGPMDWALDNLLFIVVGFLILSIIISYGNFQNRMIDLRIKELMIKNGDWVEPVEPENQIPLWKRIYDRAWALVPIEKEGDIDLGHDFDGIRELDNRLPPWWLYMFYGTIIWGLAYVYVAHYSDFSQTQIEEYAAEMQVAEQDRMRFLAKQKNLVDENTVTQLHGIQGEGGVGPNLTDPNWLHGGGVKNIFKTIKYGVPEKGMIAWKSQFQPVAIQQVSSYIMTLAGTDPPNAKEPQGEIYIEPVSEEAEISMNIEQ